MTARSDDDTYERITLERWRGYWVATDEQREVSSSPMETRRGGLDDLDENVALREGDLELGDETRAVIEEGEGEYERGETVSLEDLDTRD